MRHGVGSLSGTAIITQLFAKEVADEDYHWPKTHRERGIAYCFGLWEDERDDEDDKDKWVYTTKSTDKAKHGKKAEWTKQLQNAGMIRKVIPVVPWFRYSTQPWRKMRFLPAGKVDLAEKNRCNKRLRIPTLQNDAKNTGAFPHIAKYVSQCLQEILKALAEMKSAYGPYKHYSAVMKVNNNF